MVRFIIGYALGFITAPVVYVLWIDWIRLRDAKARLGRRR